MTDGDKLTRLRRARIILDSVAAVGRLRGRWRPADLGGGQIALVWEIEGDGRTAMVTNRLSGLPHEVELKGYDDALLLQMSPARPDDMMVDVYDPDADKVPFIGRTSEIDTLISMRPGPRETSFGLPDRDWSTVTARRLAALRFDVLPVFSSGLSESFPAL